MRGHQRRRAGIKLRGVIGKGAGAATGKAVQRDTGGRADFALSSARLIYGGAIKHLLKYKKT